MLSVVETSVFQVNRFFDKLRMTSKLDFLDNPFFIIHQQKKDYSNQQPITLRFCQ